MRRPFHHTTKVSIYVGVPAISAVLFLSSSEKSIDRFQSEPAQPAVATTHARVTMGTFRGVRAALVWIARAEGCFEPMRRDVSIRPHESGKQANEALMTGQADLATAADFVLARESFRHTDLRILGCIAGTSKRRLIARRPSGLRRGRDLSEKTIGLTIQSSYSLLLTGERWLATNHQDTAKRIMVALVNADHYARAYPHHMAQSIGGRSIDAPDNASKLNDGTIEIGLTVPQSLLIVLEEQAHWMIEHNLAEGDEISNYLEYSEASPLFFALPSAVSVIL